MSPFRHSGPGPKATGAHVIVFVLLLLTAVASLICIYMTPLH